MWKAIYLVFDGAQQNVGQQNSSIERTLTVLLLLLLLETHKPVLMV